MSSRRDCSGEEGRSAEGTAPAAGAKPRGTNRWKTGRERTDAQVGVDARVPSRARQVLVLPVRNVEMRLRVAVLLGQAKVDDVHLIATLADAHEEVVGLDVAVDERLGVDVLDARDELVREEQHRLQRELAVAEVEEVLQARSQQIEHHGVVVALGA